MPYYFRNADGDELMFVHRGTGIIETDFGPIHFAPGDYIVLPRAVTYRVSPRPRTTSFSLSNRERNSTSRKRDSSASMRSTIPESSSRRSPTLTSMTTSEWEIRIKADGEYSKVFYPYNPLDIVGWKGDLTAWKLSMSDIRPVMSHRAHLPPSAHTTFVTSGAVVCTFLPRPLEQDPEALHVPFFHRNTDYDEFIFYHDGNFFSRDNIVKGMATLHPRGIHHGPHPRALAQQNAKTHTDEYAVMLDGLNPIKVFGAGKEVEWNEYWASWKTK